MSEPMSDERLEQIKARAAAATPGPWGCYEDGGHEVFDAGEYSDGDPGGIIAPVVTKLNDAEFIAQAREDIPALLTEVKRLREAITITGEMVERAGKALNARGWTYMGVHEPSCWCEDCKRVCTEDARLTIEAALGDRIQEMNA